MHKVSMTHVQHKGQMRSVENHRQTFTVQHISIQDLEGIVALGKSKGLIDDKGNMTSEARTIYEEIRKKDHILEHELQQSISDQNVGKVYVPKSFRGMT